MERRRCIISKSCVNAVLLEGNELTSGTTWHSAGLLWQLAGMAGQMDTDVEFVQYTKGLVSETLPEETDGDWAGWQNTGAIFACSSKERLTSHNRVRLLAQSMYPHIEAYDLSPDEAKEVHPLMRRPWCSLYSRRRKYRSFRVGSSVLESGEEEWCKDL